MGSFREDRGKDRVFYLCFLAYTVIYMGRLNLSMASPAMREAGLLTPAQLGFIGSAFSLVYSCGRLVSGILGDRLAPKLLIVTGLGLAAGANLLVGILPPYGLLLILWCVNALGQSLLWSAMLRTMTELYGKARADRKVPVLVSSVSLGNVLGIVVSSRLVARWGISWAFLVPGALTALMGAASLAILPPVGKEAGCKPFPLGRMLRDRQLRGILLPALFHGAIKDNISLFMAVYFLDRFGVDLEQSAWYVLLIPTVGLVGRLAYPGCYRALGGREHLLSLICFALCAGLSAPLCLGVGSPLVAAVCLSLIYAFVSMINSSVLSMFPLRFAGKGMVSSVSGIADFATYLGAAIAAAIYGVLIDQGNYVAMFASWAALSLASMGLLLRLRPLEKEE